MNVQFSYYLFLFVNQLIVRSKKNKLTALTVILSFTVAQNANKKCVTIGQFVNSYIVSLTVLTLGPAWDNKKTVYIELSCREKST